MKRIVGIYAEYADTPHLSCELDLNAWVGLSDDLDKLVKHVTEGLKTIWMFDNGQSVLATTMQHKEMLKYFWLKRPTSFTIRFNDGTKSVYTIPYPKHANTYPNILHKLPEGWNKNG